MVVVSKLPHAEFGPNDHREIISEFSEQESIRGSFNTTMLNSFTEEKRLEHKTFRENSPYSEILSLSASSSSSLERISNKYSDRYSLDKVRYFLVWYVAYL